MYIGVYIAKRVCGGCDIHKLVAFLSLHPYTIGTDPYIVTMKSPLLFISLILIILSISSIYGVYGDDNYASTAIVTALGSGSRAWY